MEARFACVAIIAASFLATGASYRTQNFIVTAPDADFAKKVGDAAEKYRKELAIDWLGEELPPWRMVCPIRVIFENGAGGQTSFAFDPPMQYKATPIHWDMIVRGPADRILDAVLPHEITHTIFATHFGRPLPRWADEGACTTVEHVSERQKHHKLLINFLMTQRGIPFNKMFRMKDYPRDILPLYAQGYSVAKFLIAHDGRRRFVDFVDQGMRSNDWDRMIQEFYGFDDLSDLQVTWLEWVRDGSDTNADILLAARGEAQQAVASVEAGVTPVSTVAQPPTTFPGVRPSTYNSSAVKVTPVSHVSTEQSVEAAPANAGGENAEQQGGSLYFNLLNQTDVGAATISRATSPVNTAASSVGARHHRSTSSYPPNRPEAGMPRGSGLMDGTEPRLTAPPREPVIESRHMPGPSHRSPDESVWR